MPCDYSTFPANWTTEIRPAILRRADSCCEWCGAPNGMLARRLKYNPGVRVYAWHKQDWDAASGDEWSAAFKVVLTIAHLDQDRTNNNPKNLMALCQRCHLMFDRHVRRILENERKKGGAE